MYVLIIVLALIFSPITVIASSNSYWFDTSWHFRTNYTINNTDYDRYNWPIELDLNFTDIMSQSGKSGTFDNESIRVIEQNSSGHVLFEHPSQFDNAIGFNLSTNALGTLTFLLNGTTDANQVRYIYVYFDIVENTGKAPVTYPTNLNYSWDGEEIHVNSSLYRLKIDTLRGENTSGLYELFSDSTIFLTASADSKTKEYTQFSNGTHNLSFDFSNNATVSGGSIKRIVEQSGVETLWNYPEAVTGYGLMNKRYIFYENVSWIKIEQNYTNIGVSSVTRNSTSAGALSLNDLSTAEFFVPTLFGNMTNPYSRFGASDGSRGIGLINENYSSNANFYAKNDTSLDRIGIHLDSVTIAPNESITYTTIMHFNGTIYNQVILESLRDQIAYPPIITLGSNQFIPVYILPQVNYSIYNRNDSVLITANITSDFYNITTSINATFDMGTSDTSDDLNIILYDDGDAAHGDDTLSDGISSNIFNLSENSAAGIWTVIVKAFDSYDVILREENASFNMTDIYNMTLNISNPQGLVGRIVNATMNVQSSRDEYISGALINCTYGSGQLTNITDLGNGTYNLNFTAPLTSGWNTLDCNATKFNNTGIASQSFFTQTSETTMSLETSPFNYTSSNISLLLGDSFEISVNATDIGGANAKAVNISLSLPQNFSANSTFESCGDVLMSLSCIKDFNISIVNGMIPWNHTINISVTWLNPNSLTNSTNISFITYILSNPVVDILEENVSGLVPDGKTTTVGNFTVDSIGNDNLTDIIFNISGLSDFEIVFTPENISTLAFGSSQSVFVDVTVPQDYTPGDYSGTINVSSESGGWKNIALNVTVPGTTILSLQTSPDNHTSSVISLDSGESFDVTATMTNDGASDAKDVNITLSMPPELNSNSTFEQCGRVNSSDDCIKMFNITINDFTSPGDYTFNITSTWINSDLSFNSTELNFTVYVLSNPTIATSGNISTTLSDNSSVVAGSFIIDSIGNDNLTDITYTVSDLPDFTFTFSPGNVSDLAANMSQVVYVNMSVPFAQDPGNYTGTINVSSVDGGYSIVDINITVEPRREWDMTPKSCTRAENPDFGTVCLVTINNMGNVPINITINPVDVDYTSVNETNMTIPKNSIYVVEFLYNVSNVTKNFFYENYTFNATEIDAVPQAIDFNITLSPYIAPLFSVNLSESTAEQDTNIEFFANITDRSTTGLNWTRLNVTLPNGTIYTFNMSLVSTNDTSSLWFFNYSGNMSDFINYSVGNVSNYTGTTITKGIYNATIFSQDNTGVIGEYDTSFKIYTGLIIGFTPGSTKYYQGSTGSIYYTLTDMVGGGISDFNVTISLKDPSGNTIYLNDFSTDAFGTISPVPIFDLANDAEVGIYNFTAELSYYEAVLDETITSSDNATFILLSGSSGGGGGLTADIDTAVVWYPDNIMRFEMWFSYAGNVTEPDNMTLFVYDPAENLYFNITLSDTDNLASGLYHYKYAMPVNSASGYYRAVLTASKEGFVSQEVKPFRVAKGGPYDVRVMIIPPYEVARQDYVNFNIYIENMGEVTQDVYLDYWISSGDETYYRNEEAVLTPVGVNVTITRNAYIFSNQALGQSTLNVKATYDSVQEPIIATTTFEVIEEDVVIPPPPPTISGGSSSGGSTGGIYTGPGIDGVYDDLQPSADSEEEFSINIETYNKEVNIVKGWTDISGIRVRNNGRQPLNNITLELIGIPSAWYNITPAMYEIMPSGNSTLFLIEYKIPSIASSGAYPFTLIASSNEISSEKMGRLNVFTSIEDLIRQEIFNLKIELHKLEEDIYFSESIGKDVAHVWDVFNQAWVQLILAEENLDNKLYDDSLQNIQVVSGLIKQAKMLLKVSPIKEIEEKKNIWIFALKALVVMGTITAIGMWWIKNKNKFRLKKSLSKYKKKVLSKDEIEIRKKDLAHNKTKVQRVLNLLESELKEGIINKDAYDELKKINEKKLSIIDGKLSSLEKNIKKL